MNNTSPGRFYTRDTSFVATKDRALVLTSDDLGWKDTAGVLCAAPEAQAEESLYRSISSLLVVRVFLDQEADILINGHGGRAVMPAGAVSIVPPGNVSYVHTRTGYKTCHAYIRPSVIQEVADHVYGRAVTDIDILAVTGVPDSMLSSLMLVFNELLCDNGEAFRSDYVARAIAAEVLTKHAQLIGAQPVADSVAKLSDAQMRLVRAFLEANLAGGFQFAELAATIGISRSVFFGRFAATTGCTPNQYLQALRLKRAKQLLLRRWLTIGDIALACGFADQPHMTRAFKRYLGVSPAKYRNGAVGDDRFLEKPHQSRPALPDRQQVPVHHD